MKIVQVYFFLIFYNIKETFYCLDVPLPAKRFSEIYEQVGRDYQQNIKSKDAISQNSVFSLLDRVIEKPLIVPNLTKTETLIDITKY